LLNREAREIQLSLGLEPDTCLRVDICHNTALAIREDQTPFGAFLAGFVDLTFFTTVDGTDPLSHDARQHFPRIPEILPKTAGVIAVVADIGWRLRNRPDRQSRLKAVNISSHIDEVLTVAPSATNALVDMVNVVRTEVPKEALPTFSDLDLLVITQWEHQYKVQAAIREQEGLLASL
jgi:hypothetical protein